MVVTAPGKPALTQKVWLKKNKMRMEMTAEGRSVANIIDMEAKTMYMYMPAQNMAMKVDFSQAPEPPTQMASTLESYKPAVIGTETLDGKVCLVVEYTAKEAKTKAWIWTKYGLPVRTEMTTPEGKTVLEYQHIEFADIPDSMFQLPAGVQILSLPTPPR